MSVKAQTVGSGYETALASQICNVLSIWIMGTSTGSVEECDADADDFVQLFHLIYITETCHDATLMQSNVEEMQHF